MHFILEIFYIYAFKSTLAALYHINSVSVKAEAEIFYGNRLNDSQHYSAHLLFKWQQVETFEQETKLTCTVFDILLLLAICCHVGKPLLNIIYLHSSMFRVYYIYNQFFLQYSTILKYDILFTPKFGEKNAGIRRLPKLCPSRNRLHGDRYQLIQI